MTPSREARLLALLSVLLIAAAAVAIQILTRALEPWRGLLIFFLMYWFGFCLPLGAYFLRHGAMERVFSLNVGAARWVPYAVLAQVLLVAGASWFLAPPKTTVFVVLAAGPFAILNGFCEEVFWRGAFVTQARGRAGFAALGLALFTLWHIPLAAAQGVVYEGGPLALIGGAFGLGAFWMLIAWRTQSVGWPILAHMATNTATFSGLFAANFV